MKTKYLFASALFALSLGMSMTSCSGIDNIDDPIVLPEINHSDLVVAAKALVDIAAAQGAESAKTVTFPSSNDIEKIITTSDGSYIAYLLGITRAGANQVTGQYEVKDGKIICNITVGGQTYVVEIPQATATTATINGTEVTCVEEAKQTTSAQGVSICRTWYPTNYQAVVYSDEGKISGEKKIFGNYEAATLAQLEKTIEAESKTNIDLLGGELEKFSFLANGTIVTNLKGNQPEVYSWNWTAETKGEFKASFGTDKKFQNIPCFVRYNAGTPNTAEFVLECEVEVKGKNNEDVKAVVKAIITAKDAK